MKTVAEYFNHFYLVIERYLQGKEINNARFFSIIFIAVNADEKNIIEIIKTRKDFCKKFCGHNQTRIMVGRNNVVIERNEDYDKNLSLNDEDAFLYFQSNMYFYPYEDIVTLEEQIQLAKDICKRLELSGISSEIVAEFEELL